MSSITLSPSANGNAKKASSTPTWMLVLFIAIPAVLFFFGQTILAVISGGYFAIRVISSKIYEKYANEYKDYEAEHYELFRDINDLLGTNENNVHDFTTDVSELDKEQIEQEKKLLKELQRKNDDEMSRRERWQLAILSERYFATNNPMKLFLKYKADYPNDLDADFLIGKVLLDKNNTSGFSFLKRAYQKFSLILPVCELLHDYYYRNDNEEKINYWSARKNEFLAVEDEARGERANVSAKDTFVETELSEQVLEQLTDQLSKSPDIKAAWICERIVAHYPEYPVYVLAVKRKRFFANEQGMLSFIMNQVDLPETTIVVSFNGKNSRSAKKAKKVGIPLNLWN